MPNHDEHRAQTTANGTPNYAEPGAEQRANQTERDGEPNAHQWRSVQEVALLEGLTERAIQKRCQRAYYVARSVEGEKGDIWEIDAGSIKGKGSASANPTANRSQLQTEPGAEPRANDSPNKAELASIISLPEFQNSQTRDRDDLNHEVELLRVQLDSARAEAKREREFSELLKSQLEAVTQSEATTKAALREALKAMPKALPMVPTDTATPPSATEKTTSGAPQIANVDKVSDDEQTPRKSPPVRREARPLWRVILGIR